MYLKNFDKSRWGQTFDTESEADLYIEGIKTLEPIKQVSKRRKTIKQNGEKREVEVPVYYGTFTTKFFDSKFGKWYVSCQNLLVDELEITENNETSKDFNERQTIKYTEHLKSLDNKKRS